MRNPSPLSETDGSTRFRGFQGSSPNANRGSPGKLGVDQDESVLARVGIVAVANGLDLEAQALVEGEGGPVAAPDFQEGAPGPATGARVQGEGKQPPGQPPPAVGGTHRQVQDVELLPHHPIGTLNQDPRPERRGRRGPAQAEQGPAGGELLPEML